jgi:hypothetical protein
MRSDEKELLIIVLENLLEDLDINFLSVVHDPLTGGVLDRHHEAHVFVAYVDETVFQYKRFHLQ